MSQTRCVLLGSRLHLLDKSLVTTPAQEVDVSQGAFESVTVAEDEAGWVVSFEPGGKSGAALVLKCSGPGDKVRQFEQKLRHMRKEPLPAPGK